MFFDSLRDRQNVSEDPAITWRAGWTPKTKAFETKKMPGVDIGYITSWRAFTRSVSSTCEYHAALTSVCRWNHGICGNGNLGFHELQQR